MGKDWRDIGCIISGENRGKSIGIGICAIGTCCCGVGTVGGVSEAAETGIFGVGAL